MRSENDEASVSGAIRAKDILADCHEFPTCSGGWGNAVAICQNGRPHVDSGLNKEGSERAPKESNIATESQAIRTKRRRISGSVPNAIDAERTRGT